MIEHTSVPELNRLFCPTDIILCFPLLCQKLYFQVIFPFPGKTTYVLMKFSHIVSGNAYLTFVSTSSRWLRVCRYAALKKIK